MFFQRVKQKRSSRRGLLEYSLCRGGSKAKTQVIHPDWPIVRGGCLNWWARAHKGIKPIQLVHEGQKSTGIELVLEVLNHPGEQEGKNNIGKRVARPGPNGSPALVHLPWQPEKCICM